MARRKPAVYRAIRRANILVSNFSGSGNTNTFCTCSSFTNRRSAGEQCSHHIDLSFLPAGNYEAKIFEDGINADCDTTDYKATTKPVKTGDKLSVHMAPGSGWTARIYPVKQTKKSCRCLILQLFLFIKFILNYACLLNGSAVLKLQYTAKP